MPVVNIVILNLLFVAFFFGFFWVTWRYGSQEPGQAIALIIGTGLFTCVVFTVLVSYRFRRERQLGPWLIYEKATGRVTLPREGESFERQEIVHLQYVTTKRLDWGGVVNNDARSELNLITCRDGERRRWPLLRSIFTHWAF